MIKASEKLCVNMNCTHFCKQNKENDQIVCENYEKPTTRNEQFDYIKMMKKLDKCVDNFSDCILTEKNKCIKYTDTCIKKINENPNLDRENTQLC
ncbi:hypothetical protein MXB_2928, partial [Myxobolus squamalis]